MKLKPRAGQEHESNVRSLSGNQVEGSEGGGGDQPKRRGKNLANMYNTCLDPCCCANTYYCD